jgi:hypothetical protein
MKTRAISAVIVFLSILNYKGTLCAQAKVFEKKVHNFSIGYTYKTDAKWWRKIFNEIQFAYPKQTNDGVVKYEFGMSKRLGVGLEAGFIDDESRDFSTLFGSFPENYSYSIGATRITAYLDYHFFVSSHLDCYANLGFGFYAARIKVLHNRPDPNPLNTLGFIGSLGISDVIRNEKRKGIDFSAGLGMRYFFHKNFGVFSETGFNKSVFQAGIVIRIN